MLGESVQIRYQQLLGKEVDLTDDHYQGQYIVDIAQTLVAEHGDALLDESADYFSDYAKARISKQQKASLDRINIITMFTITKTICTAAAGYKKRWTFCRKTATSTKLTTAQSGCAQLRLAMTKIA